MARPARCRHQASAASGKAPVCFSRLRRSSSTAATSWPSTVSAADVSCAMQLMPRTTIGNLLSTRPAEALLISSVIRVEGQPASRRIYDCFIFFNELELLEILLHEFGDCVSVS